MPQVSPEAEAKEEKRASLYNVMELAAQFFEQELQARRRAIMATVL
jgi:DNA primase